MPPQDKHAESSLMPIAREVFAGMMQACADPEVQCTRFLGCHIANVAQVDYKPDDLVALTRACARFMDATTERGEGGEIRVMRHDDQPACWSLDTKQLAINLLTQSTAIAKNLSLEIADMKSEKWETKLGLAQMALTDLTVKYDSNIFYALREKAIALREQEDAHKAAIKAVKAELERERQKSAALEEERKSDRTMFEARILGLERRVFKAEISHAATISHMHSHIEAGIKQRPDHELHLQAWECERDATKYQELARDSAEDYFEQVAINTDTLQENKILRARLADMERLHKTDRDEIDAKTAEIATIKYAATDKLDKTCQMYEWKMADKQKTWIHVNDTLRDDMRFQDRQHARECRIMEQRHRDAEDIAADTKKKLTMAQDTIAKLKSDLEQHEAVATSAKAKNDVVTNGIDASFSSVSEISFHPDESIVDLEAAAGFLAPIIRSPRTPVRGSPRLNSPSPSPNVLTPSRRVLNSGNLVAARRTNPQTPLKITLVKVL